MASIRRTLLACVAALAVSGCYTPPEAGYIGNRLNDLTDAAHLEVTALSAGALVNVGPLLLGYESQTTWMNATGQTRGYVGLGGVAKRSFSGTDSAAYGVVIPLSYVEAAGRSPWYGRTWPPWGSIGVRAGLWTGFGLEVDAVECLDLILGLATIDILGDDRHRPPPPTEDEGQDE